MIIKQAAAMESDFDKIIERRNTSCVKYDMMDKFFGRDDLLPMWVADADFAVSEKIINALKNRLEHPILGYTFGSDSYFEAVINWLKNRYKINAEKNELHYIPGVVAGIAFCLQTFTKENDIVVVMTPVYPPFLQLPLHGHRNLVCSKLSEIKGRFFIDFEDLSKKLSGAKMLILSNPHNPGGRSWTKEELDKTAQLCAKNNVIVVSDEIHADLTLPGHNHTTFSSVSETAKRISITFVAPSKTFNMAGLSSSVCYISEKSLRKEFFGYIDGYELANGNIFAYVGAEAAFRYADDWLKEELDYIQGNINYVIKSFARRLPSVEIMRPEASYLLWINFKNTGLSHSEIWDRLINKAHVALNDGSTFGGKDFEFCFRMNVACPRVVLEEALKRICSVL